MGYSAKISRMCLQKAKNDIDTALDLMREHEITGKQVMDLKKT